MSFSSILNCIGNTPLVRINKITHSLKPGVEVYAKLEWFNPGGSVKDRAAFRMITEAIKSGQLSPDKTILDSTSGNTGIAYAMVGAALGYQVELVLPANVSSQKKELATAYGAKLTFSSEFEGSDGAIRLAKQLYQDNPQHYFMPDQYNNPLNPQAHYDTTAVEIWNQTQGRLTHFIATMGTSGTAMGCTRRLKEFNPNIYCAGGQPNDAFHGLEGLKHMPSSIVPGIYDESILDEVLWLDTEKSYDMMERLGKEEGLMTGYSSGAALLAALQVAERLDSGVIVTVFPDHRERYLGAR